MFRRLQAALVAGLALAGSATAGGTLTLQGSPDLPIQVLDHHVTVLVRDGFARTEVTQTFFNPNPTNLEAVYRVPVPENASLADMTMLLGEVTLRGEVVARDAARTAYEEEKSSGAGLAEEQETEVYDFSVSPVPAQGELAFTYVYYQPVELDTGMGRFVYPLEDGGTDEAALAFWTQNENVLRSFTFDLRIESAWPIQDVRVPGLEAAAQVDRLDATTWEVHLAANGGEGLLGRDFVVYYRLADELPGRIELLAHRPNPSEPGTFMLVVTPGIDLAPLTGGTDHVFVLDISGSMEGKYALLAKGVAGALGELKAEDRFRIVTFNQRAEDLTGGYRQATPAEVERAIELVADVKPNNGTNLFAGIKEALDDLDADRATNVILVTDGVTNEGVVDPAKFDRLLRKVDVRLFGFLLGNSANWPLMRTITEATGGTYTTVSNADDVLGQILLAKSKVTHASLLDAELKIKGVRTFDTDLGHIGKLHRGEQLVVFGRFDGGGEATVELRARLTGEDKVYSTTFEFPDFADEHPELERMWALDRIQGLEVDRDRGTLPADEAKEAIQSLGVAYQLVTEETSMLVLDDAAFARRGIERNNLARTETERQAQALRATSAPRSYRVDTQQPAFSGNAPRLGGGGAMGPVAALLAALLGAGALRQRKRAGSEGDQ